VRILRSLPVHIHFVKSQGPDLLTGDTAPDPVLVADNTHVHANKALGEEGVVQGSTHFADVGVGD
jgi:hypothetical protein